MSEQHNQAAVQAPETRATKKQTKVKNTTSAPSSATKLSYTAMALQAIKHLRQNEKSGVSNQAILKYLVVEHKLEERSTKTYLNQALRKGVVSGVLRNVKGKGASGSFAIVQDAVKQNKPRAKTEASKSKKEIEPAKKKPQTKKAAAAKTKSAPKEATKAKTPKQSKAKSAAPA